MPGLRVQFFPVAALKCLCATIGVLLVANVAAHLLWFHADPGFLTWLGSLFNVNNENNFPSAFSALNLLLAAALLFVIGRHSEISEAPASFWLLLSAVFLFLSVDEFAQVHERLGEPTQRLMGASTGIYRFAWVLPYGVLLVVFGLVVCRPFLRLPSRTRMLFAVSGGLFVAGAVGCESLGGIYVTGSDPSRVVLMWITMVEEGLEMFGIALFNFALLELIATRAGGLEIALLACAPARASARARRQRGSRGLAPAGDR